LGLKAFLDGRRDTMQSLIVDLFVPIPIALAVRIQVSPGHDGARVEAAVRQTLLAYFAFSARAFGEAVIRSDLYRVIQAVPGVASLIVERLAFAGGEGSSPFLPISPARPDPMHPGRIAPAELAVLDPLDPTSLVVRRE
jgi:hypothetical protein